MSGGALLGLFALVVLSCAAASVALPVLGAKAVRESDADRTIAIPITDLAQLPEVCARTGDAAIGWVEERSGALNPAAIFLAVLGPIGVVVLGAMWFVSKQRGVVVEVPLSSAARDVRDAAVKRLRFATMLAIAVPFASLVLLSLVSLSTLGIASLVVVSLAAIGDAVVAAHRARFARVRVRTDRDGELVSLDGVHPEFVAAVQAAAGKR